VLDRPHRYSDHPRLVYLEVARRAACASRDQLPGALSAAVPARRGLPASEDLIIDAFRGGALLSRDRCRLLLRRYAGDGAVLEAHLAGPATKPADSRAHAVELETHLRADALVPPGARRAELLLAVDPSATNELRDRGLLAYHLNDFSSALRDLQAYLQRSATGTLDEEPRGGTRADLGTRQDAPENGSLRD